MRFSSLSTKLCTRVCSPLDSSGTHHAAINLSIEAPCTAVLGVSILGAPDVGRERRNCEISSRMHFFFPLGVSTPTDCQVYVMRAFSTQDVRESVTRLPGRFRRSSGNETTPRPHITGTSRFRVCFGPVVTVFKSVSAVRFPSSWR